MANILAENEDVNRFGGGDYAVFAAVLVASAAIGVYYAFFKKQQSSDDLLMGGRKMSVFPVSLSLLCSFVSAITLLGNPVEVYNYGSQYLFLASSFIFMTAALAFLYVPVFFELQLTSAYEYFELRFSRYVRITMSVISIFYLVILMSICVFGPSLALNQVAGIDDNLCNGLIFAVCIFYSSLGGLKAVLWTDALQAFIMLGSLSVVVGKGIHDLGGWSVMWERAQASGRIHFFTMDPDLRTRQTFWTNTIGGYLQWIPLYAATQGQVQRYVSVPTLKKARIALLINMFGLMSIVFLCFLAGLAIYAKYFECDPIQSERVKAADQLLPLFVMDTLGDYPGLPGLFVAGITAASLSTVSSALNSLAAIIIEDYVKKWKPEITDTKIAKLSKFIVFGFGVLAFGGTFLAKVLGDIFPAALLLVGTLLGPTLGIFSLGMFFPWANTIGSFLGMIGGLCLMLFLAVGSTIAGNQGNLPNQKLPLSIEGCEVTNSTFSMSGVRLDTSWKDADDSDLIKFLSLSSTWFPGLGFISTLVLGLLFTLASVPFVERVRVESRLISPPILSLYKKILSSKFLHSFVKFEDSEQKPQILASSMVLNRDFSTRRKEEVDEDYTVTGFSSGKFKLNH